MCSYFTCKYSAVCQLIRPLLPTYFIVMYLVISKGPSIKYVTLFLANFDPPCHTLSHIPGPPESTSHISDPPKLLVGLVQKSRIKVPCTNSISIVRGGFSPGVWSGLVFVRSPSVTIHLLQQKVKHHFKFHVSYV